MTAAVEERIRMLRKRFTDTLPDRLAEVRRAWMRLCASPASPEVQHQLARQFHTLGGTAGSYGLMDVAGLAAEGELTCEDLGAHPDSDTFPYLATIVNDISRAVDAWVQGERK